MMQATLLVCISTTHECVANSQGHSTSRAVRLTARHRAPSTPHAMTRTIAACGYVGTDASPYNVLSHVVFLTGLVLCGLLATLPCHCA